jgi:hypothetical protein
VIGSDISLCACQKFIPKSSKNLTKIIQHHAKIIPDYANNIPKSCQNNFKIIAKSWQNLAIIIPNHAKIDTTSCKKPYQNHAKSQKCGPIRLYACSPVAVWRGVGEEEEEEEEDACSTFIDM